MRHTAYRNIDDDDDDNDKPVSPLWLWALSSGV
jgi:hypothetical protein